MADYKVKAEGLNEALSTFEDWLEATDPFAITPPHLKPIDIHEALPQEEDLDENGRCWLFYVSEHNGEPGWCLAGPAAIQEDKSITHWIAAWHIVNPSDN